MASKAPPSYTCPSACQDSDGCVAAGEGEVAGVEEEVPEEVTVEGVGVEEEDAPVGKGEPHGTYSQESWFEGGEGLKGQKEYINMDCTRCQIILYKSSLSLLILLHFSKSEIAIQGKGRGLRSPGHGRIFQDPGLLSPLP